MNIQNEILVESYENILEFDEILAFDFMSIINCSKSPKLLPYKKK